MANLLVMKILSLLLLLLLLLILISVRSNTSVPVSSPTPVRPRLSSTHEHPAFTAMRLCCLGRLSAPGDMHLPNSTQNLISAYGTRSRDKVSLVGLLKSELSNPSCNGTSESGKLTQRISHPTDTFLSNPPGSTLAVLPA